MRLDFIRKLCIYIIHLIIAKQKVSKVLYNVHTFYLIHDT